MANIQCETMKENSMQCSNAAWAYWLGIPKCRLHFAYNLALGDDGTQEYKTMNELDQSDLNEMVQRKRNLSAEAEYIKKVHGDNNGPENTAGNS